MKLGAGINQTG